jgi:hypothetical protein
VVPVKKFSEKNFHVRKRLRFPKMGQALGISEYILVYSNLD